MTQDILSSAIIKSEVVLFTGAGASVPLGLPTTKGFLPHLADAVDACSDPWLSRFHSECLQQLGSEPDIERLLELVATWGANGWFVSARLRPMIYRHLVNPRIEPPGNGEDYRLRRLALKVITERYSDVDAEMAHLLYLWLLMWIKGTCENWCPLPIFTTNYERLAERMKQRHTTLIDGFVSTSMGSAWDPGVFHRLKGSRVWQIPLFKLHGSTSWYRQSSGQIMKINHAEKDPGQLENTLIYPGMSKSDSASKEPFYTAYRYLQECLATGARLCVVIGYSFRDPQINEAFRKGLAENPSLHIVVLDPNPEKDRIFKSFQASFGQLTFVEQEFRYYGLDRNEELRKAIETRMTSASIMFQRLT